MRLGRRGHEPPGAGPVKGGVPGVPTLVKAAAGLERGERVLARAQDDHTGSWVLITSWRLLAIAESGQVQANRPWLDVDGGSWDPDTATLGLTWVGGGRALQWGLRTRTGPGRVPEAFRERVQASVVLTRQVDLGSRRSARVVIRKELRSRELSEQVLWGAAARRDDAELCAAVAAASLELRDQVGLPPAFDGLPPTLG